MMCLLALTKWKMKMDSNLEKQKTTALEFILASKNEINEKISDDCLEEIYDLFVKVSSGEDINSSNKLEEIFKKYHEN